MFAADGIAFGSASASNRAGVQFIVFLAIMLHKVDFPHSVSFQNYLLNLSFNP